jgi:3-oxoacyl-[acyl-carrier-protein] synthase-3
MNIGSEALSSFIFYRASLPNPFDLLGAVFIIEGLGQYKASEWALAIREQLELTADEVRFLSYHGEADDDHLADFEQWVGEVVRTPGDGDRIVRTARIVGRLYAMQLQEVAL